MIFYGFSHQRNNGQNQLKFEIVLVRTIPGVGVGVCRFSLVEQEHNNPVNLAGIEDDQGGARCLSSFSGGYLIL